jgi:hypothetical protein
MENIWKFKWGVFKNMVSWEYFFASRLALGHTQPSVQWMLGRGVLFL